ncbi:MAG TPA: hypothetical protein RMH99_30835 [Sandaracinaceae bacterium LLY-WYZ-13_1]|nr:hypothetical protein [Sandaracinaceae bacterium LLY-WYZ-13_1]
MTGSFVIVGLAALALAVPASAEAQVVVQPAPGTSPARYASPAPTGTCPPGSEPHMDGAEGPGCYQMIETTRRHPALFWPGFSAFAAGYVIQVAFASWVIENETGDDRIHFFGTSLIPAVGPFLSMAFDEDEGDRIAVGVLGSLQAAGLTLMILSHVFPRVVRQPGARVAFTGDGLRVTF